MVLALRLGLPPLYETPAAIFLRAVISLGDALAGQFPGGTLVADALLRGVAVGLMSGGLIATVRPYSLRQYSPMGRRYARMADALSRGKS